MHYLITYVWCQKGGREITAMECHKGTIADWVIQSMDQPENWSLINAEEISPADYRKLKDIVC